MSWSYSYTPEIWPALVTLALAIYLGSYSWYRRNISVAAKPFIVTCFLGAFWTLGVILELLATEFAAQTFWLKFQGIWQLPTAASIACFIFQYAGLGRWLTRRVYILLFLIPLLSVLLMVTNDFHHLIWSGFGMNTYAVAYPGKLFWFFKSYIYLLGFINLVVLIRLAIFSPGHRIPVAIIVSCQIVTRIVYTMDNLEIGLIGPGESILFTLGLMATAYAVALLRFHGIDPVAAARKIALQQMSEGLFVLDVQGRISDANPMASKILGIPEKNLHNIPLKDVLPIELNDVENLKNQETGHTEITLGKENSARQYSLNSTALIGRQGEAIGQLLLLHDVTEQKRAQASILEQQGAVATLQERNRLARELHDGIAQIIGYVSVQAQTVLKYLHDGNNDKAKSLLERIAEVTKDAHSDVRESIFNLRIGEGHGWSFIPTLQNYIDRFQTNYGIRTELSLADGIGKNTFDPSTELQLLRVIQEALTNCRKHSGARNLRVCVELDGKQSQITISDDGDGFDTRQLDNLDGSHFGLVFMRERMQQIGGSLGLSSTPEHGTVLRLEVPIRKKSEEF